jgi:hypothetical protein
MSGVDSTRIRPPGNRAISRRATAQHPGSPVTHFDDRGPQEARRFATAAELEYVAAYAGPADRYLTPTSLVFYASGERHRTNASAMVPCRPGDQYWPEFLVGVRQVWDAVQPLLAAIDE